MVAGEADRRAEESLTRDAAGVRTVEDLSRLLRALRRRQARQRHDGEFTYRELAGRTGWSVTAVAEYFTGKTLPPTDRFDVLVALLGAVPAEQGALATARDRVEELRRPGVALAPAAQPVPRQLPAVGRLVGRGPELAALSAALVAPAADGTARIAVIGGIGGVGKTWLALAWAQRNRARFPDGQLYVNLRGYDPSGEPVAPGAAVRGFLDALAVAPDGLPVDLDAQAALYRSLVSGRRMLVVLDNARDAAQVVPLLPGGDCAVLVTSRRRLDGLVTAYGAATVELDVPGEQDARELLGRHVGAERLDAEPDAAAELLFRCGRLPLAIAVVGARAAGDPHFSLSGTTAELRDAPARLDALSGADLTADVRAVLSWSYQVVPPESVRLLGLLGSAPVPEISLPAAASLLALPVPATRTALRRLREAYLVQNHADGRYRMHDLVHLYAAERAEQDLPVLERIGAVRRLVDFYLHTAYAGDRHLAPARPPIVLDAPIAGTRPETPPDAAHTLAWFDAEHVNLLAVQVAAALHNWHTAAWQLAWALNTFHNRRGYLHNQVAAWQLALSAAARCADPPVLALINRWLGHAYAQTGQWERGEGHLREALVLAAAAGDTTNQAHTCHLLARMWEERGEDERALGYAQQALELYRGLDNPVWQAQGLNAVGWYLARLGRHAEAHESCRAALALHRRHRYFDGEAATLDSLGYIAQRAGNHREAIARLGRALVLYRERGDMYAQASVLERLGHSHAALDHRERAQHAWHEAETLFLAQHRDADAARVGRELAGTG
ncbi:MAG TPA: helix-turn-helix domain-containing protein [Rugosimonospora sp.]|nr:helix-turn-helix domain-containing protein [Rugosimonospora sp.]